MKSNKPRSSQSKVLSPVKAAELCRKAARQGKRVVFTNGCFDILHPGHVQYLEAARSKGDFLVVALDTDAAVRKLKGVGRPVNPLKSRMAVLSGLESVDAVTWFGGANPIPTIKKLHPQVLVKGGDWEVSKILGSREVLEWGGRVYSVQYLEGKSTTKIIEKIKGK
ncbi:MAG: D-glycero-beta-D-manno-heptose 1-phosphate adenylyltransferase [Bdellovibrionota bacterium]